MYHCNGMPIASALVKRDKAFTPYFMIFSLSFFARACINDFVYISFFILQKRNILPAIAKRITGMCILIIFLFVLVFSVSVHTKIPARILVKTRECSTLYFG